MALGGIILYLWHQNDASGGALPPLVSSGEPYTLEFRVRFPGPTNDDMPPTELSGALVTLRSGSAPFSNIALWYEKASATSQTGNVYLTSSAGRLTLASASIFDDNFYNLSVVRERVTGSVSIHAHRYDAGELVYSTSSVVLTGSAGHPFGADYYTVELGSSAVTPSSGQFWGQEFRLWRAGLLEEELLAHAAHFESYGREVSYDNDELLVHWRLADGAATNGSGQFHAANSALTGTIGTGSNFAASSNPFDKFLESYAYIPGIDYGWNQEKVRVYSGSSIEPRDRYTDERFASLEFNMYDALNEDISHVMSSYEELNNFLGLPVNRYREEYEGLQQMRETYFKRLQGQLNFRVFVDMLDFFDSSFVSIVEKLIPARVMFKGDELVVESHMLERPKYQYQLRPVVEGHIEISGSISIVDRAEYYD